MSQVKRDFERLEELTSDVINVAIGTGAIQYDDDLDELVCTEDPNAERHTYARATILQKRGRLDGTLREVREAIKVALDEVR